MADVAELAGVSPKSVSRVLNGEPYVSTKIIGRVHAAMATLDYRPDRRARDLAAGVHSDHVVGFVQVDAANPWFGAVARGAEDVLAAGGVSLITGSTDGHSDREAALLRQFAESRIGGLIVAAAEGDDDALRQEADHGTAVVCVDRIVDHHGCDIVIGSDRHHTAQATSVLIGGGHRRIGFLGGRPGVWTASERRAGFEEAMTKAGIPCDPAITIMDVDDVDKAEVTTRALFHLEQPPTALVTAQDRITTGVLIALHDLELQNRVALFAYDEIPFADQLDPPVAVVAQNPRARGRRAAELLLERFAEPELPARRVVLEGTLVERASAHLPPG